ncbi:MAG: hypothetical protein LBQ68_03255, partial [Clostridiales bacterium]|nr:hypothetical protein [Clostridiales bacterium]
MRYFQRDNAVVLTETDSFSVRETLECGQCFRFDRQNSPEPETSGTETLFRIIAKGRELYIRQTENEIIMYPATVEDFDTWKKYFDLDRDYRIVKEILASNDTLIRDAVEFASGIRILRQDVWETLVSFIISQNNNIPRIRGIIANISLAFGEDKGTFYAFPSAEKLASLSVNELLECKTGFRAKYILDAAQRCVSGELNLQALEYMPVDEARHTLMSVKGIGAKIADCALLFGYGRTEVFPTDVWIARVMRHFYFNDENVSLSAIHSLASERFGEYAG